MASSEDRREVAARLRSAAKTESGSPGYLWNRLEIAVNGWRFGDVIDDSYVFYNGVFERLADLIDPTCHDTLPATWDTFECSECGTQWAVSPVYIGPDGTTEHDTEKPSYCPNCGARVTSGGER